MRVMVMVKATKSSEAGVMPSEQLLAEMGRFNEKLVKAGILLDGESLQPSSRRRRVRFSGRKRIAVGRVGLQVSRISLSRVTSNQL